MSSLDMWSPSKIDCFRRCPAAFRYRYIERVEEEEQRGGALVCGSIAHVAIAAAIHDLKAGLRIEELDPDPYTESTWKAELDTTRVPITWGNGGVEKAETVTRAIIRKFLELEDLQERVRRIEGIEVPFEVPLLDPDTGRETGIRLRGIMDYQERDEAGKLLPRELKSAAAKSAHSELDIQRSTQACAYVYGMQALHGPEASDQIAYTILVKTKEPSVVDRVVTIGAAEIRRFLLTCLHVKRAAELGVAFPAISGWQCATCCFARRCSNEWASSPASRLPVDVFAAGVLGTELSRS